jgi:hypothetical protein
MLSGWLTGRYPGSMVRISPEKSASVTAQERLKDCRARKTPTFVFESTQTGIATRKDLFAEAMLENSPTRPPRRVGDFVVSAAVQFLFSNSAALGSALLQRSHRCPSVQ